MGDTGPDRAQDHRRHLRRRRAARRRRVLGQGPDEGRPLGRLRRALRGEERRRRGARRPLPSSKSRTRSASRIPSRSRSTASAPSSIPVARIEELVREHFDLRPGRDPARPRPAPPDLREDRRLRPLRPRRPRLHVGADRQGRRAPRGGGLRSLAPSAERRVAPTLAVRRGSDEERSAAGLRRRSPARRRSSSRTVGTGPPRAAARADLELRARDEALVVEPVQQLAVVLGEADDRRAGARLERGERLRARCSPPARTPGRPASRAGSARVAEPLVDPLDHVVGERVAELVGVDVRLGGRVAHEVGEQPLDDPVLADDPLGARAAGRR